MGLRIPAVDELIDVVMAAKTRDELDVATRALDRVLRCRTVLGAAVVQERPYRSPITTCTSHPETCRPMRWAKRRFWWYDADKAAKLKAAGALK